MHDAYTSVLDTLTYSISEYVGLLMNAIYNFFQILILETDSNGNVVGFNFLGTCIILILGLYLIVWGVSFLLSLFAFGQKKENLPTFSDIENEMYWENQFNNELKKDKINWNRLKYSREQALLFRTRNENNLNEELRNNEVKAMKRWKVDKQLEKYRNRKK